MAEQHCQPFGRIFKGKKVQNPPAQFSSPCKECQKGLRQGTQFRKLENKGEGPERQSIAANLRHKSVSNTVLYFSARAAHSRAKSGDAKIENVRWIQSAKYQPKLLKVMKPERSEAPSAQECRVQAIQSHFALYGLPPATTLDFYEIVRPIGKGAFGTVYEGTHRLTSLRVAVKSIEKSPFHESSSRNSVFQEVLIMKKIVSPYVIRLLEVFETFNQLFLVLEHADGGDLLQLVKAKGKLTEREAKSLFWQVLQGLAACHAQNVAHRDIKLSNVLLSADHKTAKIADFGISQMARPAAKVTRHCGTPSYLSPEIVADTSYDPYYADIWSLGVLLYAMLCGSVPFRANTIGELYSLILAGKYSVPESLSIEAAALIRSLLHPVPSMRPSLSEIAASLWLATERRSQNTVEQPADLTVLRKVMELGFSVDYVLSSLRLKDRNHATATYHLIELATRRV